MQPPKITGAAFMALLALSLDGRAAEWSMTPGISLRTGLDDNIRLTSDDSIDDQDTVWELRVTPRVNFGMITENKGITGKARYSVRRFHGGSGANSSSNLDREDAKFNLNSFYNTYRDSLGLALGFTRDSTLDSELDETGKAISQRATRLVYTASPYWSRILTERMRLNLNYRFTKVEYSDDFGVSDLTEYESHFMSSSLERMITERTSASAVASYSRYEPETNLDSRTLSLQGGLSTTFSETLSASFLAGWRKTTSDQAIPTGFCIGGDPGSGFPGCGGGVPVVTGIETDDSDNDGSVYTFKINKQFTAGSLSASLVRQATPTGSNGQLLETNTLRVYANRRIRKRLTTSITAQVTDRETITSTTSGINPDSDNRKYYAISPSVTWNWSRDLDLSATYRYRKVERDVTSDNATSNAFYLTLDYRLPKMAVSR